MKNYVFALAPAVLVLTACGMSDEKELAVTKSTEGLDITLQSVNVADNVGPVGLLPAAGDGAKYVEIVYDLKNTANIQSSFEEWPKAVLVDAAANEFEPDALTSTTVSAYNNPNWADQLNPSLSTAVTQIWKLAENSFDRGKWKLVFKSDPAIEFDLQ